MPHTDTHTGWDPGFLTGYKSVDTPGQYEKDTRAKLPFELADQFANLQKFGFLGQQGAQGILGPVYRASSLRRRALSRSFRSRLGGRLGSRAPQIENFIANKVQAPELEGLNRLMAGLLERNQLSKLGGLEGLQQILQFLEGRFEAGQNREAQKPGFLDYIPGASGAVEGIRGLLRGAR